MDDLTTRYSLERRTCGCTMHVSATGKFVLAADYDALITRLRAAESATTPVRLRARRLALGMDALTATRAIAAVLDARPAFLEAIQQRKSAFLEASLMALEDGTFHGDPSACVAAYDAVLRAADDRTAWQPIETAPRDGADVIALDGEDVVVLSYHDGWRAWVTGACDTYYPTHWMPLPAAPEVTP